MKLSTRSRYGLRVMLELARRHGQGPVLVETVEQSQGISGKYIHQIMQGLRNAGLVRTVRGPGGGYELVRDPSEVTALEVITVLEGPLDLVECIRQQEVCETATRCVTRELWHRTALAMQEVLSSETLQSLCRRMQDLETDPSNYSI